MVAGFLFSHDGAQVLMVRKTHPAWMAGKLNGIGGQIEAGESPVEAMRREFAEEAGLLVPAWEHFLFLDFAAGAVWFFRAFAAGRCWPPPGPRPTRASKPGTSPT